LIASNSLRTYAGGKTGCADRIHGRGPIGYDRRMSFFDAPPPPPPRRQPPRPEWQAAPDGWLGGMVRVRPALVRTGEMVVTLEQLEAFPTGVRFDFKIVTRRLFTGLSDALMAKGAGAVRLGVAFSDGSQWQSLHRRWPSPSDDPPPPPVLWLGGGSGNDAGYTQHAWLWPLPPAGPVTFAFAWPEQGIDESTVAIDGGLFHAAAAQAEQLWPPLTPEERAAVMEGGLSGSHGFMFAIGPGEAPKK
jgi:hypothetical protein